MTEIEITEMTSVEEIIWHEREAERLTDVADDHRWKAAELIAAELATGKTQCVLADEINKSQTHVSLMAQVWRDYQGNQGNRERSFDSYYQQAKKSVYGRTEPTTPKKHPVKPYGKRANGVVQRQASIDVRPKVWEEFKEHSAMRGIPASRALGQLIARKVEADPPVYEITKIEYEEDPYAPTYDSCGLDNGFTTSARILRTHLATLVYTNRDYMTEAQRIELSTILKQAVNYLEERENIQ